MACDLEESTFVPFSAVTLELIPIYIACIKFLTFDIFFSESPTMFTLFFASSLGTNTLLSFNKSNNLPQ
jgi:hypothetical protein